MKQQQQQLQQQGFHSKQSCMKPTSSNSDSNGGAFDFWNSFPKWPQNKNDDYHHHHHSQVGKGLDIDLNDIDNEESFLQESSNRALQWSYQALQLQQEEKYHQALKQFQLAFDCYNNVLLRQQTKRDDSKVVGVVAAAAAVTTLNQSCCLYSSCLERLGDVCDLMASTHELLCNLDESLHYYRSGLNAKKLLTYQHNNNNNNKKNKNNKKSKATTTMEPLSIASSYFNIGYILQQQHECTDALHYYQMALSIYQQRLDHHRHHQVVPKDNGAKNNNIGDEGRDDANDQTSTLQEEAEEQQQLQLQQQQQLEVEESIGDVYVQMGDVYQYQGKRYYPRALKCYQLGLQARQRALGMDHPDVAVTYTILANMLQSQGKTVDALDSYQSALSIYQSFNENDNNNNNNENNNASTCAFSLDGSGRRDGHDDTTKKDDFDTSFRSVASTILMMDDYINSNNNNTENDQYHYHNEKNDHDFVSCETSKEDSLTYYRLWLETRKEQLGDNHPQVAKTYAYIATILFYQDKKAKAIETIQQAFATLDDSDVNESNVESFGDAFLQLGFTLEEFQCPNEAMSMYERGLALVQRTMKSSGNGGTDGHHHYNYSSPWCHVMLQLDEAIQALERKQFECNLFGHFFNVLQLLPWMPQCDDPTHHNNSLHRKKQNSSLPSASSSAATAAAHLSLADTLKKSTSKNALIETTVRQHRPPSTRHAQRLSRALLSR